MYCGKCGNQIDAQAKFCPRCGAAAQLSAQTAETERVSPVFPPEQPKQTTGTEREQPQNGGAFGARSFGSFNSSGGQSGRESGAGNGQSWREPYAPNGGYPQEKQTNGKAVAAMVLGIVSLCYCWGVLTGILAIIFGTQAKREQRAKGQPTGMASAGIVMGIIGLALWTLFIIIYAGLVFAILSANWRGNWW